MSIVDILKEKADTSKEIINDEADTSEETTKDEEEGFLLPKYKKEEAVPSEEIITTETEEDTSAKNVEQDTEIETPKETLPSSDSETISGPEARKTVSYILSSDEHIRNNLIKFQKDISESLCKIYRFSKSLTEDHVSDTNNDLDTFIMITVIIKTILDNEDYTVKGLSRSHARLMKEDYKDKRIESHNDDAVKEVYYAARAINKSERANASVRLTKRLIDLQEVNKE